MVIPDLVSVIVPVFNRPRLVREAVASALTQAYRPIEIVLVDDGSTDETVGVVETLAREHPGVVRPDRQENGGPGRARERGRRLARGEFIQYLDSDDVLLPGKLDRQVEALRANPQAGVAYCETVERLPDGTLREPPLRPSSFAIERMFPTFVASRWWNTVSPLYRAAICERAGPWSDLWLEEDWEMDARVAALGQPVVYVPRVLAEARDSGGARLSGGSWRSAQRLQSRARAHLLILDHALRGGVARECAEMVRFARELFLLARQCGATGLVDESRDLFEAARRASAGDRSRGFDFRSYRIAVSILGWVGTAKLASAIDGLRPKPGLGGSLAPERPSVP